MFVTPEALAQCFTDYEMTPSVIRSTGIYRARVLVKESPDVIGYVSKILWGH